MSERDIDPYKYAAEDWLWGWGLLLSGLFVLGGCPWWILVGVGAIYLVKAIVNTYLIARREYRS